MDNLRDRALLMTNVMGFWFARLYVDKAQTGILAVITQCVLVKKAAAILIKTNTDARMEKGHAVLKMTV